MVTIDPAGGFTYTPTAGYAGPDSFTFSESNVSGGAVENGTQDLVVTLAPSISSAASATFASGTASSFTVGTTAFPAPTLSDGAAELPTGITFTDNGDGTATLSGTPLAGTVGTYPITITATNGLLPVGTQAFTLSVTSVPFVTTQPVNQSVAEGATATFEASATGSQPVTGQWQVSSDHGTSYVDIPGATSNALSISATRAESGNLYRMVFTNTEGSVISEAAGLTVTQPQGYGIVESSGGVTPFGDATFAGHLSIPEPAIGMAATPDGKGYWLVAADGGVFSFGDAAFFGSEGAHHLNQPIVAMATTPDGGGYWLVGADGGIFSFGDASFYGSTGNITLNQPIVGMAPTPDGRGYWLVAADGGIFSFGDAAFFGSEGTHHLNQPIVAMSATPDGRGYWLVAGDGGVFNFGDTAFLGSEGAQHLKQPIVAMATTPDGGGYWLVGADGGIFSFGDGRYLGSLPGLGIAVSDVIGLAP